MTGVQTCALPIYLKVLLECGLVEREQRGSWAFFRVKPEPLAALRAILA